MERELNTLDERLAGPRTRLMTLLTTPSRRMCWRSSVIASRRTSQTRSDGRSFSCSCAGLRCTPQLTDRGRKQVRVVIDYRFPRVGEAHTGIAASSRLQSPHALSPPEPEPPHHRPHPVPTAAAGLLSVPVSPAGSLRRRHPEGPGNAPISRSHASLRVIGLTGWRAGRLSETSPYASGHDSRDGRLVLTFISYI